MTTVLRSSLSCLLMFVVGAVAGCRSNQSAFVAAPSPTDLVTPVAFESTEATAEAANTAQATAESAPPAPATDEPERLPPPELSAEAEPLSAPLGPPTLDDVIRSVVEYFPAIQQATAQRRIAYGQVLETSGAFDHKLDLDYNSQPLDFYENHWGSVGVKRDTTWGGQTFAGYKIGRGVFEPWYLERETNKGGEFKAGFMAPILRDRAIDANRSELWQAQVERQRAEAILRIAVINATRDGSSAYWEWVAAAAKLKVAEQVLQLGLDRVEAITGLIEAGVTEEIDVVDNRRIILSRQAKVVDSQRKLRQTAAKLSLYLRDPSGQPLVAPADGPVGVFYDVGDLDSALAAGDILFAQTQRPEPLDLRLIGQQLRIAIRQACNETWPDVDAGLLVAQDVGERTSDKGDKSEFEVEARLTLSVPLERRKAFGKLRQLRGKLAQVRAKERLVLDKIGIDVQVARAALEAAAVRVEQTTEAYQLALRMSAAEQTLYDQGLGDLFNLNIREKQAADAAVERIDAQLDYHLAAADYAAALGVSQPELITGPTEPQANASDAEPPDGLQPAP